MDKETSHINEFEADFLIQLCLYLILQGYNGHGITILTPYTGQMFLLKKVSVFINLSRFKFSRIFLNYILNGLKNY